MGRVLTKRLVEDFGHSTVDRVLAALGVTSTEEELRWKRNKLLRAQLQPQGKFGPSDNVYSTGNGCLSRIGWLDSLLDTDTDCWEDCEVAHHLKYIDRLNLPPKQLGRGTSEILSLTSSNAEEYDERLKIACDPVERGNGEENIFLI